MNLARITSTLFLLFSVVTAHPSPSLAQVGIEPDWSTSAKIAPNGRANPYEWDEPTLKEKIRLGKLHALNYPVKVTGLLLPARSSLTILNMGPSDPLFGFMKAILSLTKDFQNFNGFWDWLGLVPYPASDPHPYPMGVSVMERHGVQGATLSCAACHSSELFGKQIIGMTNRFPRANLFFSHGQTALKYTTPALFASMTGANHAELVMYRQARIRMCSIAAKAPAALGLDTSLAQVARSLAKRAPTLDAERTAINARNPRPSQLDTFVADSKPAVWWNVKYKNRWLSDGSVTTGNPIFTNFLWNEIGRGVDLPQLLEWLALNTDVVQDLTTAVFATEAPQFKDFFGENSIHIERAKRGEKLYIHSCAQCHGVYGKAWSLDATHFSAMKMKKPELSVVDTIEVRYPENTPITNVDTDSNRREGMQVLADSLNPLRFSQEHHIVIEKQNGYVPPPLVGIWARYPYLHNNSIPNLCALMTAPEQRPVTYYSGKAINKNTDYDLQCMGYPVGKLTPASWRNDPDHLFDTRKSGLSNQGHFEKIFTKNGQEKFSPDQKQDLIEYLKTL